MEWMVIAYDDVLLLRLLYVFSCLLSLSCDCIDSLADGRSDLLARRRLRHAHRHTRLVGTVGHTLRTVLSVSTDVVHERLRVVLGWRKEKVAREGKKIRIRC
jgi:CelD/BcsL family acetyltransferase involved in cellulose biosynthesis